MISKVIPYGTKGSSRASYGKYPLLPGAKFIKKIQNNSEDTDIDAGNF